jgi:predicted ATPase with chaperone activity
LPLQLTKQELADLFGITTRRVDMYIQDGMPRDESTRPHTYTTASFKWIRERFYEPRDRRQEARASELTHRLQELEVEKRELELGIKKGEILRRDEVLPSIELVLHKLARSVKTLPKHAGRLVGLRTPQEHRAALREAAQEVLDDVANETEDLAQNIRIPLDALR